MKNLSKKNTIFIVTGIVTFLLGLWWFVFGGGVFTAQKFVSMQTDNDVTLDSRPSPPIIKGTKLKGGVD